jgi:hypothetical protein
MSFTEDYLFNSLRYQSNVENERKSSDNCKNIFLIHLEKFLTQVIMLIAHKCKNAYFLAFSYFLLVVGTPSHFLIFLNSYDHLKRIKFWEIELLITSCVEGKARRVQEFWTRARYFLTCLMFEKFFRCLHLVVAPKI